MDSPPQVSRGIADAERIEARTLKMASTKAKKVCDLLCAHRVNGVTPAILTPRCIADWQERAKTAY